MKKLLLLLSTILLFSSNIYAQERSDISIEEKITALYIIYFQRAADYSGLLYWSNQAKQVQTEKERENILKKISDKFSTHPIFFSVYGKMNNQTFIEEIYKTSLGEAGDNVGLNYWRELLDNGMSRSDMITMFVNSSLAHTVSKESFPNLTTEEIKSANLRKKIILNRIELALYFSSSLKELSNIENTSFPEEDPAYIASKQILSRLYINPLDIESGIASVDNAMQSNTPIEFINRNAFIQISGTITYARPKLNTNHIGLKPNSKVVKPAQQVLVKLLDENSNIIMTTTTDDQGRYNLPYAPRDKDVKVMVSAIMKRKQSSSSWDIKVVDNTEKGAIYTVEGKLANTKNSDNQRDLHIPLINRASAPFSILNDIYSAMKKIIIIESTLFPPLVINWSANNTPSEGLLEEGQIGTSFFNPRDNNIFILGDKNSDSDEFDTHVIIHEWGHYFEENFSRSDSIGGSHGEGDMLDIRVAFGEGFGNAWSAIVTDNPIYTDTTGGRGWFMNIEQEETINSGWWSEGSIQKIIYDLYDGKNEPHDQISLGLKPIYDILTTSEKESKAFTSIFSFITALKDKNPSLSAEVDRLLSDENINSIADDIYGEEHHDLYSDLGDENICTSSLHGDYNKLLNHKYLRFTVESQKSYTIRVEQTNGDTSDPDFFLYGGEPFGLKKIIQSEQKGLESSDIFLTTGDYILDVSDYNNLNKACFKITIQ